MKYRVKSPGTRIPLRVGAIIDDSQFEPGRLDSLRRLGLIEEHKPVPRTMKKKKVEEDRGQRTEEEST